MTARDPRWLNWLRANTLAVAVVLVGCGGDPTSQVILDGLSQPRGISIDGATVCVAEAGSVPPGASTGERDGQVEADTGRVLCRDGAEPFETVLSGLPFVYYPDAAVTSGAADVVHDETATYALIGESFGEVSRSIVRVTDDGPEVIADLLAFAERRARADGEGIRSNPWSMVTSPDGDGFLVADAATGQVLSATLDGRIDVSAPVPGHEVLTGMAWGTDGALYVASFGQLPHQRGTGAVVAIDHDGSSRTVVGDLTMVIDVGFDSDGGLFILEYAVPPDEPGGVDAYRDRSGRLLYVPDVVDPGEPRLLLENLDRPTALGVRADAVIISTTAGEQARGEGSLVEYPLDALLPS